MVDFMEKFSKLYEETKNVPKRNLKVISTEDRGDDLGSYLYPEFGNSNLSLFLLSQNVAEDGFVEKYCLDDENLDRLKIIRKRIKENLSLKDELIKSIEQFTQIPYEKFKKMPLGHQEIFINNLKRNLNDDELEEFNKKFENLTKENVKVKDLIMN